MHRKYAEFHNPIAYPLNLRKGSGSVKDIRRKCPALRTKKRPVPDLSAILYQKERENEMMIETGTDIEKTRAVWKLYACLMESAVDMDYFTDEASVAGEEKDPEMPETGNSGSKTLANGLK